MKRCGYLGCEQWAYGPKCYFHEKTADGLFEHRAREDEPLLRPGSPVADERTSVILLNEELKDMALLKALAPGARVFVRRRRRGIRMGPVPMKKGA